MLFEPGVVCLYFVWYFPASFDFCQEKSNIQENQFSFLQSKKNFFMKHKAKLMGNDYLT